MTDPIYAPIVVEPKNKACMACRRLYIEPAPKSLPEEYQCKAFDCSRTLLFPDSPFDLP